MRWFSRKNDCSDERLSQLLTDPGTPRETAIERMLDCISDAVRRHVLDNSGTAADAEDVIQETAVVLLLKARNGALAPEQFHKAYVRRIAANIWVNELRRRKRQPADLFDPTDRPPEPEPEPDFHWPAFFSGPGDDGDDAENARSVNICFQKLGEKCRRLLWLHYVEKRPWEEVARQTEYKNGKVCKAAAVRCKDDLRECFKQNRYPDI